MSWIQLGQDLDGEKEWVRFGRRVALSADGNILVASGQTHTREEDKPDAGIVRTYSYDESNDTWNLLPDGTIYGQYAEARMGESIALSSDRNILAVGSYRSSLNGFESCHVDTFRYRDVP